MRFVPIAADVLARAEQIADEVLFPTALQTDAAELLPAARLDVLARAGLYGMAAPASAGGLDLDLPTACRVVEILAGGCLSTALVWLQHHGAVRGVATAGGSLAEEWLVPLCRGEHRAGVAIAGIRPGVASMRARRTGEGWRLRGEVPWVTGWGLVDVVYISALDESGDVVRLLVDAVAGPSLRVEPVPLVAANATGTVNVSCLDHHVPADRLVNTMSYQRWQAADAAGLRMNGSLALGVAGRCTRLLAAAGPLQPAPAGYADGLEAELDACRRALDAADPDGMPAARAAASLLAARAAATLAVAAGSRAVRRDEHASRLAREALLTLVFASRPAISTDLLTRLAQPAPGVAAR
jgi:alkylation response protein AidB-like acyl-CoA dehydrogenase